MFEAGRYKDFTNEQVKDDLEKEGCHPLLIEEAPNDFLESHTHAASHILVIVDGEMRVKLKDKEINMKHGDKLTLGSNIEHTAHFGPKGCKYFWVEF